MFSFQFKIVRFTSSKVYHSSECFDCGKNFNRPFQGGRTPQTGRVFRFYSLCEMLAKLWLTGSLVQVNSLLDESKPSRRLYNFLRGDFFFSFSLCQFIFTPCFFSSFNFSFSFVIMVIDFSFFLFF